MLMGMTGRRSPYREADWRGTMVLNFPSPTQTSCDRPEGGPEAAAGRSRKEPAQTWSAPRLTFGVLPQAAFSSHLFQVCRHHQAAQNASEASGHIL